MYKNSGLNLSESDLFIGSIEKFTLDKHGEWISYSIKINEGEEDKFHLLEWHLDEDLMESAANYEQLAVTDIRCGTTMKKLRMAEEPFSQELDCNGPIVDEGHPGFIFKKVESLNGSILYRSLFKGEVEQSASLILIREPDRKVVMTASLLKECKISMSLQASGRSQSRRPLSYASVDSTNTTSETSSLDEPATDDVNSHFKRLIVKAHNSTVYGMYDLPSLIECLTTAKTTENAPLSFILSDDGTAIAFRAYIPPSGKARANILLFGYDSIFLDPMAKALSEKYPLVVYVCDTRGFGHSSGKRGYAARATDLYTDVRSFVRLVRNNSDLPIFLCTHLIFKLLLIYY